MRFKLHVNSIGRRMPITRGFGDHVREITRLKSRRTRIGNKRVVQLAQNQIRKTIETNEATKLKKIAKNLKKGVDKRERR